MVKDIILAWLLCNTIINTVVSVKYFVSISKPFIANTTYPPTNHQRLGVGRRGLERGSRVKMGNLCLKFIEYPQYMRLPEIYLL